MQELHQIKRISTYLNSLKMINVFSYLIYGYLFIGLFYGIWFITKGIGKVDKAANSSGWGLRLLWLPGSIAMWPFLLKKSFSK